LQPLSIAQANGASPPISPLIAAVGIGGSPSVPSEWICPLSNKIMSDPVTGAFFFVNVLPRVYIFLFPTSSASFTRACDFCLQPLTESTMIGARFAIG
jgi:hypothetical protein